MSEKFLLTLSVPSTSTASKPIFGILRKKKSHLARNPSKALVPRAAFLIRTSLDGMDFLWNLMVSFQFGKNILLLTSVYARNKCNLAPLLHSNF